MGEVMDGEEVCTYTRKQITTQKRVVRKECTVQIGRQVSDLEQKTPLTHYMIFFVILPLSYVSKFGRGFFFHI